MAADIVRIVYGVRRCRLLALRHRPLLTLTREISNRQKPAILLLDVNEGLYFKYFYWKKKKITKW
jgi:hypothetical protein